MQFLLVQVCPSCFILLASWLGELNISVFSTYSYCCPFIALAQARSHLDGSSCCFNCCAMNPAVTRWLIRSAYGIPGSAFEDCYTTYFCPCCSINQMLQTTKSYGNPTPDGGAAKNLGQFTTQTGNCSCGTCCYSFFCCPCAIATTLNTAMDMPFCFALCCVNCNFCMARNLVRYQLRIAGDDCCDDFCWPTALATLSYCLMGCPCCLPCSAAIFPYFMSIVMKLLTEVENRTKAAGGKGTKYLQNIGGGGGMQYGGVTMVPAQVVMVSANVVVPVNDMNKGNV